MQTVFGNAYVDKPVRAKSAVSCEMRLLLHWNIAERLHIMLEEEEEVAYASQIMFRVRKSAVNRWLYSELIR